MCEQQHSRMKTWYNSRPTGNCSEDDYENCSWRPTICMTICGFSRNLFERDILQVIGDSRWRHQIETFSSLLAICAGNSQVTGEFPSQRPVTRSFDVFFDLRVNRRVRKQLWGWWFKTPSRPLWRHCNVFMLSCFAPRPGNISMCSEIFNGM